MDGLQTELERKREKDNVRIICGTGGKRGKIDECRNKKEEERDDRENKGKMK